MTSNSSLDGDSSVSCIFTDQFWSACGLHRIVLDVPHCTFGVPSTPVASSSAPSSSGSEESSRRSFHFSRRRSNGRSVETAVRAFISLPNTKSAVGTSAPATSPTLRQSQHAANGKVAAQQRGASAQRTTSGISSPSADLPISILLEHPRSCRSGRRQRADATRLSTQFANLLGIEAVIVTAGAQTLRPSGSGSSGSGVQPPALFSSCVSSPTDSGSDGVYSAPCITGKRKTSSPQDVGLTIAGTRHLQKHANQGVSAAG